MRDHPNGRRRPWGLAILAAVLGGLVASSALAANIVGTPGNDVLRGTANADRLLGKGGNDRLFGMAGDDYLQGGAASTGTSVAPAAIPSWPPPASTWRRTAKS